MKTLIEPMGVFEFGRKLIESKDVDPVYVLLWNCPEVQTVLKRWLIAYWCFYHMGTSSWIADGGSENRFWGKMEQAAASKEFPRCPERRHFRGQNAVKSVSYLRYHGIDKLFEPFEDGMAAREVMKEVQKWVGFGPWISFKVADMLERLDLARIVFKSEDVYLFDSPKEGAERMRAELGVGVDDEDLQTWAVETLTEEFRDLTAPPNHQRLVGPQEAETVLCKWKSYLNGSYRLGEDIESCRNCLLRFAKTKLSQDLLRAGRNVLW